MMYHIHAIKENESEVLRMQREITAISEIWKKSVEWERAMENASLTTASPSLSHHMKKVLWQFRLILMPLYVQDFVNWIWFSIQLANEKKAQNFPFSRDLTRFTVIFV